MVLTPQRRGLKNAGILSNSSFLYPHLVSATCSHGSENVLMAKIFTLTPLIQW
ncbi:hypothetical protein HOLleu_31866 [Holothuria leucospilota]|uniref:Uncharacterized protein n=1 Tax=Holothuria leucospilota TaxID=206669 RepID=A0A9Q0YR15_HOLLE|nr:hypothetical protein HOLleu_31866 [Holothuria leucospilota]